MKKIFALLIIVCAVFTGCESEKENTGEVSFTALDGLNSLPIENVRIVIPEGDIELYTDKNGKTEKASVKTEKVSYCTLKENEGMFTVFAFCEGYNDYALFYATLENGEERDMRIYLFKLDTPLSNGKPLATVESPDNEAVLNSMDKYK